MSRRTVLTGAAMIAASLVAFLGTPAAQEAASKVLGSKENAKWSPTTIESASAPENRKVLDGGKQVTITGEVVDVSCFLQLGKRGPAHADCGAKCIRAGQPAGILDDEGNLVIVIAEQHHPRRDGQVSLAETMASLIAQRVTATGMLTENRGTRGLFLHAPEVVPVAPAAATAAPAPAAN